jgi:hypothetical protein
MMTHKSATREEQLAARIDLLKAALSSFPFERSCARVTQSKSMTVATLVMATDGAFHREGSGPASRAADVTR